MKKVPFSLQAVQERSFALKQLKKHFNFTSYQINCFEEGDTESTEYYDCLSDGKGIEVAVTYEHGGHWTYFKVEYKNHGSEDWHFLDSFEEYIR